MNFKDLANNIKNEFKVEPLVPDWESLRTSNIDDLLLYFSKYHESQSFISKQRHLTTVVFSIIIVCLSLFGILYNNHNLQKNQSEKLNKQLKLLQEYKAENDKLKSRLLDLSHQVKFLEESNLNNEEIDSLK